jgi:hypothetical protein
MRIKQATPQDFRRIFEEMPGGPQVLEELTRRFGRAAYVPGGTEGTVKRVTGQGSDPYWISSCAKSTRPME